MAIVNAIPELWRVALERAFDKNITWGPLATDLSAEFASGGDRLHINEVSGTITFHDYVAGTPLATAETPDDSDEELVLSQRKYFNIAIEDIERFQARAAVFEEWTRLASLEVSQAFDRYIYSVYNTEWDDDGADATRHAYTKTPAAVDEGWRQGLVDQGLAAVRRMDEAFWPQEGRWMVITTEVKQHLLDYLIKDKPNLGQGTLVDGALTDAAFSRLFGVNVRVDPQLPTAAAENNPYFLFGLNDAVVFGRQIQKVEAYRPQGAFQDALKGLYVYGAHLLHPDRKMAVVQAA